MITKTAKGRLEIESAEGGISRLVGLSKETYADLELTLTAVSYDQAGVTYSPFHGSDGVVTLDCKMTSFSVSESWAQKALDLLLKKKSPSFQKTVNITAGKGSYTFDDKDMSGTIEFQMLSPIATHLQGQQILQVRVVLMPKGKTAYLASKVVATGVFTQVTSVETAGVPIQPISGKKPTDPTPELAWKGTLSGSAGFTLSRAEQTTPSSGSLVVDGVTFVPELAWSMAYSCVGGTIKAQVPKGPARLTLVYGSGDKDIFDIPDTGNYFPSLGGVRVAATPAPAPAPVVVTPGEPSGKYKLTLEQAKAMLAQKSKSSAFLAGGDGKRVSASNPLVLECLRIHGDAITHFGGGNEGYGVSEALLWKPVSDNTGKLVIITPHGAILGGVRVDGEAQTKLSIGNGWRAHYRFSKPGSAYSGNVEFIGTDDKVKIPSPGAKTELRGVNIAPGAGSSPVLPPIPTPVSDDKGVFKLLMLTDVAQDLDLQSRVPALKKLAEAYGCFLYLDLQYPVAGSSKTRIRPYIGPGRDGANPTGLLLRNMDLLASIFRQIVVCPLGGWGAANGYGRHMGSVKREVSERELYTSAQLDQEMALLDILLARYSIQGVMPTLEGRDVAAVNWTKQYAARLQGAGYKGSILSNLIGASTPRHGELRDSGVLLAPSINDVDQWGRNGAQVWNTDGMTAFTQDRPDLIQKFTGSFGPNGYILWSSSLVGSTAGRSSLSDVWAKNCARPLAPAAPVVPIIPPVDPVEPTPVPVPQPTSASRGLSFDAPLGFWCETGTAQRFGYAGKLVVFTRSAKVAGALNFYIVHPLYSPLKDAGPWGAKARGVVQDQINKAKAAGFNGIAVDAEGSLWTSAILTEVAGMIRAAGLLSFCAPKATMDPGGRRLTGTWAGDARVMSAYDAVGLWSYGSHTVHVQCRNNLLAAGAKCKVAGIHDEFRMQDKGYIGKQEGPKLAAVCKKDGWTFVSFQPQYKNATQHAFTAKLFAGA